VKIENLSSEWSTGLLSGTENMTDETAAPTGTDPLKAVADAMDAAVMATKEGAEKARALAEGALPASSEMLSKAVYNTCYAISFGVVFPSVFLARTFPKNNAVAHGLSDGAQAAIDMVNEMKSRPASGAPH
jgi:hypothetical protein